MVKHAFHARLTIWHVLLMVIVLGSALPMVESFSSTSTAATQPLGSTIPDNKD